MPLDADIARAIQELGDEGRRIVVGAFKQSLGNVEAVLKALCPVGYYPKKAGATVGGNLQNSLRVVFVSATADLLTANCASDLPYARYQHEGAFHHPGKYTKAPGPQFRAAYFERGGEIVFGSGHDPLGMYNGPRPAGFQELIEDAVRA